VNDGFGERAELIAALLEMKAQGANASNQAAKDRVGAFEMTQGSGRVFHGSGRIHEARVARGSQRTLMETRMHTDQHG